jgi:hypothetical protein
MNNPPSFDNAVPRSMWPRCAKCDKTVDHFEIISNHSPVAKYRVQCHGETEEASIGIWAAFECAQQGKGLPDAFHQVAPAELKDLVSGASGESSAVHKGYNFWFGCGFDRNLLPEKWMLIESPGDLARACDPYGNEYFVSEENGNLMAYPRLVAKKDMGALKKGQVYVDTERGMTLRAANSILTTPIDRARFWLAGWQRATVESFPLNSTKRPSEAEADYLHRSDRLCQAAARLLKVDALAK